MQFGTRNAFRTLCRRLAYSSVPKLDSRNPKTLVLSIAEQQHEPDTQTEVTMAEETFAIYDAKPSTLDAIDSFLKLSEEQRGFVANTGLTDPATTTGPVQQLPGVLEAITGVPEEEVLTHENLTGRTPLQQLESLSTGDPGQIRLSVTKILTGAYCELQKMYDLYMGVTEVPSTPAMIRGTKEHERIELQMHPVKEMLVGDSTLKLDTTLYLPQTTAPVPDVEPLDESGPLPDSIVGLLRELLAETFEKKSAHGLSKNVSRLAQLATCGQAREILVHGYYDKSHDELVNDMSAADPRDTSLRPDLVLISGIIDLLSITGSDNAFSNYQQDLAMDVTNPLDLAQVVPAVHKTAELWSDELELCVTDLKTRSFRRAPPPSTQEFNLVQVAMYARFLEILSASKESAYEMLLLNLRKRGIDPQTVIDPASMVYLLLNNHYLIADAERLQNGNPIGFAPYDTSAPTAQQSAPYLLNLLAPIYSLEPSDSRVRLIQNTVPKQLALEAWKTPPTFELLAARTAQLLETLNHFRITSTSVEYSFETDIFASFDRPYSREFANHSITTGMDLWLAKRPPMGPASPYTIERSPTPRLILLAPASKVEIDTAVLDPAEASVSTGTETVDSSASSTVEAVELELEAVVAVEEVEVDSTLLELLELLELLGTALLDLAVSLSGHTVVSTVVTPSTSVVITVTAPEELALLAPLVDDETGTAEELAFETEADTELAGQTVVTTVVRLPIVVVCGGGCGCGFGGGCGFRGRGRAGKRTQSRHHGHMAGNGGCVTRHNLLSGPCRALSGLAAGDCFCGGFWRSDGCSCVLCGRLSRQRNQAGHHGDVARDRGGVVGNELLGGPCRAFTGRATGDGFGGGFRSSCRGNRRRLTQRRRSGLCWQNIGSIARSTGQRLQVGHDSNMA
ncbi:hypothetical protein OGAPHI_001265 [Ogataea philodendri]|uniref:Exonuclease V, mitochondrial n=1 Tax=Ogataea philodendri TaxID=1378263 RepID=A0A9P8PFY9_9ASCO|nr:uncharacterized protein OGAPHI_001265 [Ogataea philodendri]KAH3670749.1 hypothetical protein OGAPHI_001265 [Ogataea philodendri]